MIELVPFGRVGRANDRAVPHLNSANNCQAAAPLPANFARAIKHRQDEIRPGSPMSFFVRFIVALALSSFFIRTRWLVATRDLPLATCHFQPPTRQHPPTHSRRNLWQLWRWLLFAGKLLKFCRGAKMDSRVATMIKKRQTSATSVAVALKVEVEVQPRDGDV